MVNKFFLRVDLFLQVDGDGDAEDACLRADGGKHAVLVFQRLAARLLRLGRDGPRLCGQLVELLVHRLGGVGAVGVHFQPFHIALFITCRAAKAGWPYLALAFEYRLALPLWGELDGVVIENRCRAAGLLY